MEGLNELLKLLADKLGVGIEHIQQNASLYIEEYGRYALVGELGVLFICGAIMLLCYSGMIYTFDIYNKRYRVWFILGGVLIFLFPSLYEIAKYLSSPQMYGIEELLKLLK